MSDASWALQSALYAALSADEGIQSVLGDPPRIYDAVPRAAAMPYLVIGDDTQSDWSTATETGSEHGLTFHVWSRALGRKESKAIAAAVQGALKAATLAPAGFTLVGLYFRSAAALRQTDGRTWHTVLRFRAVLEPQ
jgi:hypothetical protein